MSAPEAENTITSALNSSANLLSSLIASDSALTSYSASSLTVISSTLESSSASSFATPTTAPNAPSSELLSGAASVAATSSPSSSPAAASSTTQSGVISATTPGVTSTESGNPDPELARRLTILTGGAKAGIAVGVVLIVCMAVGAAFIFMRRRKRLRQRTGVLSGIHEKGFDNPSGKPELMGTIPATSGVPYRKPELEARTKIVRSEISSSGGTTLPYGGGNGAPAEPDREEAKQLVESERLTPHYMEFRDPQLQTGEPSSPSIQRLGQSSPTGIPTNTENLHTLKAQERELAHKMEVSESLQRLRAEHAALLDRIRIAEMMEREVHAGR